MNFYKRTSCNTKSLLEEIKKVREEIGRLQLRLWNLEQQLYEHSSSITYEHSGIIPDVKY